MTEPEFLTVEDVLAIHADQLATWGGTAGVRDHGMLASAVAMPQATAFGEYVHEDLFTMAAAYAFHLAESQCFLDGNKRVGLAVALTFLAVNGFAVADPHEALFDAMIAMANRTMTKAGLAALLRELANV